MSTAHFLGIDPGQSGGAVLLNEAGEILSTLSFVPHKEAWPEALANFMGTVPRNTDVYLEHVHAMPKQGVSSMFTFGKNFGLIKGILIALGWRYKLVFPRVWTKCVWVTDDGDAKDRSIFTAMELWDMAPFLRSKRCQKPDQGLIDAALIAEYGRRVKEALSPKEMAS